MLKHLALAGGLFGLLAHPGHAQSTTIRKGTFQLGGAVSYQRQHSEQPFNVYDQNLNVYQTTQVNYDTQYFFTNPTVGYFVADNLAVGLSVASTSHKTETSYDNTYGGALKGEDLVTSSVSIGVFAQYYRLLNDWFGLTTTLGVNRESVQQHAHPFNGQNGGYDYYGFNVGLTPGVVVFPHRRLALGAAVGGLHYGRGNNGPSKSYSFDTNFGLSYLTFSGTYFLHRRV